MPFIHPPPDSSPRLPPQYERCGGAASSSSHAPGGLASCTGLSLWLIYICMHKYINSMDDVLNSVCIYESCPVYASICVYMHTPHAPEIRALTAILHCSALTLYLLP